MKNDNDLLALKLKLDALRMVRPNNPAQHREQVKQIIQTGALIELLETVHTHGVSLVH
ncbi:hypothetical protein GCM10023116_13250 [Kistimonas scapharcae]|uniref:Uncharacterized protein n=1 Tax=Kistimonas scapharcae TaxID=1036133 RepID=A0ABP8UZT9_9GAMM